MTVRARGIVTYHDGGYEVVTYVQMELRTQP